MQKTIVRNIAIFAIVGLILVTIVTYVALSSSAKQNQDASSEVLLEQVDLKLQDNNREIEELKDSLSNEYLDKARAFSRMIKLNPSILEDKNTLVKIMNELGVDELHVTNEKGVLLWGTVDDYIGFDFSTSDQAGAFMKILDDPTYELAQEPTPNGAEGVLFQYVGVARQDKKGIVQVGILPSRLDEALANNSIQNVVNGYKVGKEGFIFAVNRETNLIEAFPNEDYLGKTLEEAGLGINGQSGMMQYAGTSYYYRTHDAQDYKLVCVIPKSEMYAMRNTSLLLTIGFFALVFIGLVIVINIIIKNSISDSLGRIVKTVQNITDGDMKARVNERKFEEFSILSDGINGMVENIANKMDETNSLMEKQEDLISEVVNTTGAISEYTQTIRKTSESLSVGSTTQAESVEQISSSCNTLLSQVSENSKNATEASRLATESQEMLGEGMRLITEMGKNMVEMDEASRSISQVIGTVSSIAFQTNILALNASVEAARAGEAGSGFAVVAQEVRSLATKCSEAATDTAALIEHAIATLEKGEKITDDVSEAMNGILVKTRESTRLVQEISEATAEQLSAVGEMNNGLSQISDVIQSNARLANESDGTVEKLFGEVDRLERMVSE